jgi:hypothetical protein
VQNARIEGIAVPANIGARGTPVPQSATVMILDALRDATASDVVVLDLEDGTAWWETRLLVLLEGADRLGKPSVVVFVGMGNGITQRLQGWGYATELLRAMLHPDDDPEDADDVGDDDAEPDASATDSTPDADSDAERARRYRRFVQRARAAGHQWDLVGPHPPNDGPHGPPNTLPWRDSEPNDVGADQPLAIKYYYQAFDDETGDRDHLFVEKALASELSIHIEENWAEPWRVTPKRLTELFGDAVRHTYVDQRWSDAEQSRAFLESDDAHLVLAGPDGYEGVVSRVTLLNEYVRSMVEHANRASDANGEDGAS